MITARKPLPEALAQDVKRWRPRFPREWLDEVELDGRFKRLLKPQRSRLPRRLRWSLILLGAALAAMAVPSLIGEQGLSPQTGAVPHTLWMEGMIEDLGPGQDGRLTATVVGITGKSVTAGLDFGSTSVFQEGHVLHIGHLRPGQYVRMVQVKDRARAIEILPQAPLWGLR